MGMTKADLERRCEALVSRLEALEAENRQHLDTIGRIRENKAATEKTVQEAYQVRDRAIEAATRRVRPFHEHIQAFGAEMDAWYATFQKSRARKTLGTILAEERAAYEGLVHAAELEGRAPKRREKRAGER